MREINNIKVDNAKDTDVVMPMYNLIEYCSNYSKTSGRLLIYGRNELTLINNGDIIGFRDKNTIDLFKLKQ